MDQTPPEPDVAAAPTGRPDSATPLVPQAELGRRWRAARAQDGVVHLDAAAASRPSIATITAQVDHLRREVLAGAYVAEMEAAEALAGARARLAALLGPGLTADDVAFQYSATTGFGALLAAWPLPPGSRIGVVPGDYGANLLLLASRAARDGLELLELPVDELGRIDLGRLDRAGLHPPGGGAAGRWRAGLEDLALVTFPQVPSQRGVVQPAAEVAARCAAAGVDLVLDVAQSLGQVDVTGIAASAWTGTSRKWLCGPRGAGFVAVRPEVVERLGVGAPSLYSAHPVDLWDPGGRPEAAGRPLAGMARLSVGEASVASRVGLATALSELFTEDLSAMRTRIAALARHARRALDGVAGWRLGEEADSPCGIVTLRPPPNADPLATSQALYRRARILTGPIPVGRAPELTGPVLRISAHVDTIPAEIDQLAEALDRWGRPDSDREATLETTSVRQISP
ncbi:aminotransferase class V-fold PLP-dependent enzyme [Parafrankia sp. EUN1f]|uniref:aminotransferase class V-fold PLP-dependent enzyme n=1 Tax=Parafrankia sp. EUN1f TaxID=102897 RepID=UPI0001C44D6D|nr:aminotransferase class V-fold PLP-dependent enzyme [Parafrankia sp. EUN1f]EFC85409.1 aminotransferase class V [Parafrankia sp. EUN1f]